MVRRQLCEGLDSRKSLHASVFKFAEGKKNIGTTVCCYQTTRQKTVTSSTMEAEEHGICEAGKQTIYLRSLLEDIFSVRSAKVKILNDNTGAIQ